MVDPAENENGRREATYADVLAAPAHKVAEIVDGELYLSARPAAPHAVATSVLGHLLIGPFHVGGEGAGGGPGGWWILDEPELHFWRPTARGRRKREVLVPDLAGWRRERLPTMPDEPFFRLAPDWLCEVTSPSTAGLDRIRKMAVYAREGVRHLWILDPGQRSFEAYRLEGGRWLRVGAALGAETVRAEPFEAAALDLSLLWPAPPAAAAPAGDDPLGEDPAGDE